MNRCALLLCGFVMQGLLAADAGPGDADSDAVRRQTAEIERLQQELRRAQAELDRLRSEGGEAPLGGPPVSVGDSPVADQPPVPPSGVMDVGALPTLREGEVLLAADLLRHYETDPEAADQRYRGQTLQVRGTISGFHRPLARRVYDLRFDSPGQEIVVICRFSYVDQYRTVYSEANDRVLVAKAGDRTTKLLYRRGDPVTVRGRCQGLRDGSVRLIDCSRVD